MVQSQDSISITWELVRDAGSWAIPDLLIKKSGLGTRYLFTQVLQVILMHAVSEEEHFLASGRRTELTRGTGPSGRGWFSPRLQGTQKAWFRLEAEGMEKGVN